jgi:intracellular sulfur oxidation DsrE/DsrF family protein
MFKFAAKWSALLVALAMTIGGMHSAVAEDKPFAEKKIVLQISDPNPFKQTLVLNVANNLLREYGADKVAIEIVAFGPGLRLLFADNANTSRIQGLSASGVEFRGCSNTKKNMAKKLGYEPAINPIAKVEGPGVVRIVKLVTEDGYTLVKP